MDRNEGFGMPGWLQQALEQFDFEHPLWLVGGTVRDWILQREGHDFDFVTSGSGRRAARMLADELGAAYYPLDESRDTGRVVYRSTTGDLCHIDVATFRGKDLNQDLRDRDFTINAMAVPVDGSGTLVDITGGRQDLLDGVLRACSPQSLASDPVRILRAVRIATELHLIIDPSLTQQIRLSLAKLNHVSNERMRDELFKIFMLGSPGKALRVLHHTGVLEECLDIMQSHRGCAGGVSAAPLQFHTIDTLAFIKSMADDIKSVDINADLQSSILTNGLKPFRKPLLAYLHEEITPGRNRYGLLVFYLLLDELREKICSTREEASDFKDQVESISRAMRLSNTEMDYLVRLHIAADMQDPGEDYLLHAVRSFRIMGDALPAGILHNLLQALHKESPLDQDGWLENMQLAQHHLDLFFNDRPRLQPPQLINGQEIMDLLDMRPGPEVGHLVLLLEEAQVLGLVGTREEAEAFLKENGERRLQIEETDRYQKFQERGET